MSFSVAKRAVSHCEEERTGNEETPFIVSTRQPSFNSSFVSSAVLSSEDAETPPPAPPHTPPTTKEARNKFVRPLVFGGVDGLSTTLTLVWGAAALGTDVAEETLLTLGVANLLAKGCSMGLGDYFGTQAENRVAGIAEPTSYRSGVIMFVSFVVFGGVPLVAFIPSSRRHNRRTLLCVMCATSLFLLGLVKAYFTSTRAIKSGMVMVSAGGLVALTSYLVGHLVYWLLGVPD